MKKSLTVLLVTTFLLIGCYSRSEAERDMSDFNSMGQNQLIQNTTQVSFDITVPAYQSDELSVELVWGDKNLKALWIGDEFWSASSGFPTQTEHILIVTFFDKNGEIEVASFSQNFKTGTNAAESLQISADQFDASQFDTDKDGVNNLDELVAGTDPSADEDSYLEIVDEYALSTINRMSVSRRFESRLSEERPFFHQASETKPRDYVSVYENIDIDTEGNGTLSQTMSQASSTLSIYGTRTRSESSVSWEGVRNAYDGDYRHQVNFINTIAVMDETRRSIVEEATGTNAGIYRFSWETSVNLTGRLIDGTSLCKPIAGTVSSTYRKHRYDPYTIVTTITKKFDDPYWHVVRVKDNTKTTEYFARELRMFAGNTDVWATDAPEDAFFVCDFVDL